MSRVSNSKNHNYLAFDREPDEILNSIDEQKNYLEMGNKYQIFATKADLSKEVADLKVEFHKEFAKLNIQIASLVKWIVGFGITIILIFISIFLRK